MNRGSIGLHWMGFTLRRDKKYTEIYQSLLKHAMKQQRILTDTEILKIIRDHGPLPELPEI